MSSLCLFLIFVSLAVLVLGTATWRLTSSRPIMLNTVFGSFCLLFAAFETTARSQSQWAFVLPFFVTMLFSGRVAATWWRSRKETELRTPALLLTAAAVLSLLATVSGYFAL